MTSQPSSSPLSVEDMEMVMQAIDNPTPTVVTPTPAPAAPTPMTAANSASVSAPARPNPVKVFVDPDRLKDDVAVDPDNLDAACMAHSGLVVHYGLSKVQAKSQLDKMKAAFEILEAQLYEQKRADLEAQADLEAKRRAADESLSKKDREKGAERVTDTAVTAAVKTDRRWWTAKNRVIDANAVLDAAGVAFDAFMHRRDMIVTIGANSRVERQGELRVMARERENQDARDRAMQHVREAAGKGQ